MCIEDPQLQDGFHAWSAEYIKELLVKYFTKEGAGGVPNIDVVLTFDAAGVSGHPNHRSVCEGAKAFAEALHRSKGGAGWEVPVAVYSLGSVNIARKYSGAFDVVVSVLASFWYVLTRKDKDKTGIGGLKWNAKEKKEREMVGEGKDGRVVNMAKLPTH